MLWPRPSIILSVAANLLAAPVMGLSMNPPSRDKMESYLQALDAAVEGRLAEVPRETLSISERVFASVWDLEAEVNNGGFSQYFCNSSGEHALDCPNALRAIGATHAAQIAQAALDVVGMDIPWTDDKMRRAAISKIGPAKDGALDALDTQFHTYPDDLTQLLFDYCVANKSELPLVQS
jgi:hypothetical protein